VEVDGESSEFFLIQEGTVQGSVLGPILFNLFMRPLLEKVNGPAYADDSYHCGHSRNKQQALEMLHEKINIAVKWITDSGLKVNLEKTEVCVFHRTDTSRAKLKLGDITVESQPQIGVLGIIIDNRLTWDQQIHKVITDSRKSLQAVRLVRSYFTKEETIKLVTSLVYSRLYYASEAWLLPTLKERLFNMMYSQSGKILKIVDRELSFRQSHIQYNRATPRIFSLYQTCVNFYNVMKFQENDSDEKIRVITNTLQANRNEYYVFIRQNAYKCGLNTVSNRLRSVSNMIKKDWLLVDKKSFKTLCKKNVIQQQLSML
jgi:hypothetical protein